MARDKVCSGGRVMALAKAGLAWSEPRMWLPPRIGGARGKAADRAWWV